MELGLIENKIYTIGGYKVMLDFDLAEMYAVETRRLKEQVKRNIERFPSDFMFQLTKSEWQELIANCDNLLLINKVKFSPVTPFAFSQEGVAMLSGVLHSPVAIQYIIANTSLEKELNNLKTIVSHLCDDIESIHKDQELYEHHFDDIYLALTEIVAKQKYINKPRNPIGYNQLKK